MNDFILFDLFWTFVRLAVVAVGGMNTVIPEVARQVVDVHGWMSRSELADLIALAQASPGPNGLVVSLVGWQVAGLPGFLVTTLAISLPPAILAFAVSRIRRRLARSRFLKAAQTGLVPIVIGLMLASGVVTAQATDDTWIEYGMTVVVAFLVWRTRLNPLWLLGGAAIVGLAGVATG
jgi:chromate transporter